MASRPPAPVDIMAAAQLASSLRSALLIPARGEASLVTRRLIDSTPAALLSHAITRDAVTRPTYSLLYIAAHTCDAHTLALLLAAGAEAVEDVFTAAVECASPAHDATVCSLLTRLYAGGVRGWCLHHRFYTRLTLVCRQKGYSNALALIDALDGDADAEVSGALSVSDVPAADSLADDEAAPSEGDVVRAFLLLREALRRAAVDASNASSVLDADRVAARACVRRVLDHCVATGCLSRVLARDVIPERDDEGVWHAANAELLAARTHDIGITAQVVCARKEPRTKPQLNEDVYFALLSPSGPIVDESNTAVTDAQLAIALRQLFEAGARLPDLQYTSPATRACVRSGRVECARVMMDVIDGWLVAHMQYSARPSDLLLDAAASAQATVCSLLLQRGWSMDACSGWLTPVGHALTEGAATNPNCVGDTLAVFLGDVPDVRSAILQSGVCAERPPRREARNELALRVQLFVCAVLQAYPTAASDTTAIASVPMDVHVHDVGVHIPDPYRVTGQVAGALQMALLVDERYWDDKMQTRGAGHVSVMCSSESSPTLRRWAWMRRLHAAAVRAALLQAIAVRRH